jgi:hypothetical protein
VFQMSIPLSDGQRVEKTFYFHPLDNQDKKQVIHALSSLPAEGLSGMILDMIPEDPEVMAAILSGPRRNPGSVVKAQAHFRDNQTYVFRWRDYKRQSRSSPENLREEFGARQVEIFPRTLGDEKTLVLTF